MDTNRTLDLILEPMRRRDFIHAGAIVGSGCVIGSRVLISDSIAQSCNAGPPPGVQLFTVRNHMAAEPRKTLQALSDLGIKDIQIGGLDSSPGSDTPVYGLSIYEFNQITSDAGLRASVSHIGWDVSQLGLIAERAHALDVNALVMSVAEAFVSERDGRFDMVGVTSIEQLDRVVDWLNQVGLKLRELGLTFGYHNHHVEFIPIDGTIPFNYLMENTDPDLVKVEFDVAWLAVGGVDPAEYLRRYEGRVIACHLKDFDSRVEIPDDPAFLDLARMAIVEPGAGTVDFTSVLQAIDETGVEHAFIEIDFAADALAAIDRSNRYLQGLRNC